jgi:lysophospholipase L1-like esterase
MQPPKPIHQAPAGRVRGFLLGLGVLVTVLAIAVVALEVAGRFVPALSPDTLDPEKKLLAAARVEPHPYLAYANKPGFRSEPHGLDRHQISHNQLGFRGPETTWDKPEGVWRIVCLGGSSTYGHGPTSDATTWPARLQAHLNEAGPPLRVEVINGGCQGYSTFESLVNLSLRMVDLEPDLVVVYHAINDARCALWPRVERDNTHWRALWPIERTSALERLLSRSTTWLLLKGLDPAWKAGRSGDLGWYAIVGYPAEDWKLSPSAELGFASVRRNLESIVAVSRGHGAQVVLGLQAMRWSDLDRFGTKEAQVEGLRRVLQITREVGGELDVPVVDLAAPLEAEAERQRVADGKDTVFTSEVHLTNEGADLLARTLAQSILELGLVRQAR